MPMNKIKFKLIPLFLIFINGFIMAMTMESGYFIKNFEFKTLLPYQILPLLFVLGIIGVFRGEGTPYKIGFLVLTLISGFYLYRLVLSIDFMSIPQDIQNINNVINSNEFIEFEYFETTLKLVMLLSTSLLAVTLYIFPYNMIMLDAGLLIFLWIVDYNGNRYEYVRYFIPVWTFSILSYRAGIQDEDRENYRVNHKKRLVNALAFTLVISITSLFINVEAKGVYSDRLRNYFTGQTATNTSLTISSLEDAFNLRQTGYNNSNTTLGGDITINEEEVLRATGNPIVYLRGNVKTTYTGREWLWEDRSFEEESSINDEKISKFESLNGDAPLKQLEIRPTKQITSSLFHSLYTKEVTFNNNIAKIFYDETFDTFTGNKTVANNYLVKYYDESLLSNVEESSGSTRLDLDKYLNFPETITGRTINLVQEIVTDEMTNREKAVAITDYLKSNYDYTLTPGDLPEGEDFVDHFLFETKEGYCVYFGTALTMMLRISGVPSRYIEGFKMGDEQINGAYVVRNSDAHAWTEVLVDEERGIWETFDATGTPREMIFGEDPLDEIPVEEPETPVDEESPEVQTPTSPGQNGEKDDDTNPFKLPVVFLVLIILGAGLLFRMLYKSNRWQRIYQEKSLKPYFREINKALDLIYYHKGEDETYLEFAERIKEDDLREKYRALVQETYKEEYGGEKGTFEYRREFHEEILSVMKEYRGGVYTSLKKYLF